MNSHLPSCNASDASTRKHGRTEPRLVRFDNDAKQRLDDIWELTGNLRDDPEIHALIRDAATPIAHRRRPWRTGLAVAATLLLGWIAQPWNPDVSAPATTISVTTAEGEQRTVELPDHSKVMLNSSTQLVANLDGDRRTVTLVAGEATFTVEPDGRPFEVRTPEGVTRVLGTIFNVQLLGNGTTQVSVLRGKVTVEGRNPHPGDRVDLTQGLAVRYDHRGLLPVESADTERILSWHSGRIRFHEWPLTRIIEEYNRYTPEKLRVEGGENILFSGSFTLDNKEELISTLQSVFDINIYPAVPDT